MQLKRLARLPAANVEVGRTEGLIVRSKELGNDRKIKYCQRKIPDIRRGVVVGGTEKFDGKIA